MRLFAKQFYGGRMRSAVLWTVLVVAIAVPAAGYGQWIKYPTEGVPRNPDGTPNLQAPTPRPPDGKPDLSGIWHASNPNRCAAGASRFIECGTEIGGSPLGGNLGRNLPGGLPYQPWAAKLAQERRADDSRDDPHVRCLPDNPPRAWTLPHLTKAVHTPKLLVLLHAAVHGESDAEPRGRHRAHRRVLSREREVVRADAALPREVADRAAPAASRHRDTRAEPGRARLM
jgi:hypothetical protein